jgi:hypothetical protein
MMSKEGRAIIKLIKKQKTPELLLFKGRGSAQEQQCFIVD